MFVCKILRVRIHEGPESEGWKDVTESERWAVDAWWQEARSYRKARSREGLSKPILSTKLTSTVVSRQIKETDHSPHGSCSYSHACRGNEQ